MTDLQGRRIAFLTAQDGVEKAELEDPRHAVVEAGATAVHLAPDVAAVGSMVGDVEPDRTFDPDLAVADAKVADFDALVLPGGTVNAARVRGDADSVGFVRAFVEAGKPVAAICHGPWALVEAGVLPGKTATSYPSLRTDIVNAGGRWVDEEVQVCTENGWTLITSRNPADIPAFSRTIIETVAAT